MARRRRPQLRCPSNAAPQGPAEPQDGEPSSSGSGSGRSDSTAIGRGGARAQAAAAVAAPWALMGRVVKEDSLWQGAREALVARAVAEKCGGLSEAELSDRLEALAALLPMLRDRLLLLRADLLAELAGDVGAVARKLVQLRLWFPTADLGELLGRRPSLLSEEEFSRVPAARRKLLARYPEPGGSGSSTVGSSASSSGNGGSSNTSSSSSSSGGSSSSDALPATSGPAADPAVPAAAGETSSVVDALVARQPLLLVEDLDGILGELKRLLPGSADAAAVLAGNPDILLSCQRGTASLGPGAEF